MSNPFRSRSSSYLTSHSPLYVLSLLSTSLSSTQVLLSPYFPPSFKIILLYIFETSFVGSFSRDLISEDSPLLTNSKEFRCKQFSSDLPLRHFIGRILSIPCSPVVYGHLVPYVYSPPSLFGLKTTEMEWGRNKNPLKFSLVLSTRYKMLHQN